MASYYLTTPGGGKRQVSGRTALGVFLVMLPVILGMFLLAAAIVFLPAITIAVIVTAFVTGDAGWWVAAAVLTVITVLFWRIRVKK